MLTVSITYTNGNATLYEAKSVDRIYFPINDWPRGIHIVRPDDSEVNILDTGPGCIAYVMNHTGKTVATYST